ncbi:hypothetical protein GCM10023091_15940 [Ravibacter arvi]|uniref:LVIVD repeat-containing protein n=1 Tax=Ravibacter arvi TaxID=2051041 RepID=A0ABP8LXM3_9BACT
MRLLLLPLFVSGTLLLGSCTDKCEKTQIVRQVKNITLSAEEIRAQLKIESPRSLEQPGKIYVKDNYLFINEIKKGIHIIDNSNPSSPRQVSFINIPGNGDLAVKDNILYADSYMDLVAIDITDPAQAVEVGREQNVFISGTLGADYWGYSESTASVSTQEAYFLEETFQTNCEGVIPWAGGWWPWPYFDVLNFASLNSGSSYSGSVANAVKSGSGTGGSMARFTIYDNYLYTVDQRKLQLFEISNLKNPSFVKNIDLQWGVETIFPYRDKLFIGTTTGMHIFDNSVPSAPKHLSTYTHMRACDPVVVHNDIAYVTLRTGTGCGGTENRLELVDISNLSNPRMLKAYDMQNPAGLSINYPTLFLCEGKFGFKGFDVTDRNNIDKNLLFHEKDMESYDVISMAQNLMMIGMDGLYQYDASNPKNLKRLSHIPVQKPAIVVEKKK